VTKSAKQAETLPLGLPTAPTATVPAIAPVAPQTRPFGCHRDHDWREVCPFAGRAPECAPCEHWDADWATFEAACARPADAGLIPKALRVKKAKRKASVRALLTSD
jgi:hypothetical protein